MPEEKKKRTIFSLVVLIVAGLCLIFLGLVVAHIAGAAVAAGLGIGAAKASGAI